MSRLPGLYPRAWRERYGAEMEDLLLARPPSLVDRLDLLRGALDAWIHPQVRRAAAVVDRDAEPRPAAGPAILALLGGVLFVAGGWLLGTAPYFTAAGYKDTGTGVALLIAGMLASSVSALFVATEGGPRRVACLMICGSLLTIVQAWPIVLAGFYTYVGATIALGVLLLARRRWLGLVLVASGVVLSFFNTEDERALAAVAVGSLWILIGVVRWPAALKALTGRTRREPAAG